MHRGELRFRGRSRVMDTHCMAFLSYAQETTGLSSVLAPEDRLLAAGATLPWAPTISLAALSAYERREMRLRIALGGPDSIRKKLGSRVWMLTSDRYSSLSLASRPAAVARAVFGVRRVESLVAVQRQGQRHRIVCQRIRDSELWLVAI
jgi:hypothetical protein